MPKQIPITGLLPGTNYIVTVSGMRPDGSWTAFSQAFPFTTVGDTAAPDAPVSLVTDFTTNDLVITWNGAPSKAASDFKDFEVSLTANATTVVYYTASSSFTMSFLENKTQFGGTPRASIDISIKARDTSGNLSTALTGTATNAAPTTSPTIITNAQTDGYTVGITYSNAPTDIKHIEILQYAASTGGTGTSKWTGLASVSSTITATAGTQVWVTARYVDVFGLTGPETTRTSVTPTAGQVTDTTPPANPTSITLTASADTSDLTGSTGYATLSWTAPADSDLSGYEILYGATSTAWDRSLLVGKVTSTSIYGLNSGQTYWFKMRAYDTSNNFNASYATPSPSSIAIPRDSVYGTNAPAAPTGQRNATKILLTHSLNDSTGTARLPADTDRLEFHISTSSGFTPSLVAGSTTLFQSVPVTVKASNTYVGTFDYPDGNTTLGTRYLKVVAYDKAGNASTASAQATITTGLSDPIFASAITVGDAQIGNLSANKLIADTAIANNLNVTSTLTIGASANDGYLKSFDYVAGTSGWQIGHNGSNYVFEVNQGVIKAGALQLQPSANLMRLEHSVFSKVSAGNSIISSNLTTPSLLWGSNISSATTVSDSTANPAGGWALQVSAAASGTDPHVRFVSYEATTTADKNYIPIAQNNTYIISGWFKADTTRACYFSLTDGTNSATATGTFSVTTSWTRFSQTVTWTAADTTASLRLHIPNSAIVQVKGLQVERKSGTLDTPSNYVIPGGAVINGSAIKIGSISSNQYLAGSAGWAIDLDGNAEFNNVTARGTIKADTGYFSSGYIGGTTQGWTVSSNTISNNLIGLYAPLSNRRTNLAINSQFQFDAANATSITGWSAGTNTSFLADATSLLAKFGTIALRMKSTTTNDVVATSSGFITVVPGLTYNLSAYLKSSVSKVANVQITWYDQAQATISTYAPTGVATTTSWTRYSAQQAAPANAVYAKIGIKFASSLSTDSHWVDGVLFEQANATLTYFDGSSYESAWGGVAHNSTSIKYSDDVRSNLILNPSFQNTTATTGYTKSSTISAIAADTSIYKYGTQSLKATAGTSSVAGDQHISFDYVTVTPGETYSFTSWVYIPTGNTANTNFYVQLLPYDITSGLVSGTVTGTTVTAVRGVWTRLQAAITIPADTTIVKIIPRLVSASQLASGQLFYTDGWLLEESSSIRDYFDGSTYAYSNWTGTVNNSISTMNETAFYVGGSDRNSSSFMINYDGSMYATKGKIGADLNNAWTINSGSISYVNTLDNNLLSAYDPSFEEKNTTENTYWTATYSSGSTQNASASKYINIINGAYTGSNAMNIGRYFNTTPGTSGYASTDKDYTVRMYKAGTTKFTIGTGNDFPTLTVGGGISFSAYVKSYDIYSRSVTSSQTLTTITYTTSAFPGGAGADTSTHSFNAGDEVVITGMTQPTHNGTFVVASSPAPTSTTFSVINQPSATLTGNSGTATVKTKAKVRIEFYDVNDTPVTGTPYIESAWTNIDGAFTKINIFGTIPSNTAKIVPVIYSNNRDLTDGTIAGDTGDYYAFTVDYIQLQAVNSATDTSIKYPMSYYLRTNGQDAPIEISDYSSYPIFKVLSNGATLLKHSLTVGTPKVTKSIIISKDTIYPYDIYGLKSTLNINGPINVAGTVTGTAKNFDIIHPTKSNMRLTYGSLEGPEYGVYIRGRSSESKIVLPDYWAGLVHEDSITVTLTPIGQNSNIYVESVSNYEVSIGGTITEYFYLIQGERKDLASLEVEYDTIA